MPAGWPLRVLALAATFSMTLAQARADVTWVGGVGNYGDGANWSGGGVPMNSESILINNGGTAQIAGTDSFSVGNVTLGSGGAGALEIGAGITAELDANEFYVGRQGAGTLTIGSQALLGAGDFWAGYAAGATGTVNASGAYLSPFTVYLGYEGNATVTLENGSTLQSTTGYVGYSSGSHGIVNLTNSTWKSENQGNPRDVTVGVSGWGEVHATTSQLSVDNLLIAANIGSVGDLSASGGVLTIEQDLTVGSAGTGTLTLTNSASAQIGGTVSIGASGNGTLETTNATLNAPDLFVAQNAGSTGSATVAGGAMTLTGELHVGASGAGTFTLEGGATLNTDKGNMGFASGSTGTINVLDGTWTNTQAIFVGASGEGTLNIGSQGVIHSESGYLSQEAIGEGNVNFTGGSWFMSNTLAVGVNGNAELSMTGGEISSKWSQVGLSGHSTGVVKVANATWTTGQTLTIGVEGNGGEFYASNGANVTAGAIELGASANVTGLLSVVDSTLTTVNILQGGGSGSVSFSGAQLKLLGGSSVVDTLLIDGFAADATVLGSGGLTIDTQGGNAQIPTILSGAGGLTKAGSGRLRLTTANTYQGGTKINGGLLELTNSNALGTGNVALGSGELRAYNSVTLSGDLNGGIQLISVSGGQTGVFSAAPSQTLTLAPLDFLLVDGSTMQVGSSGQTGDVVFAPTGAVALPGDASLNVVAGKLLAENSGLEFITSIASSTTVASGATLDFQDHLATGGIRALFGEGTVNTGTASSTMLTIDSGNFAGNIAGPGGIVKESSGTLTLSGQTAFYGGTMVNAGTLLVNGSLSFGLGSAWVNPGATLGGSGIVGDVALNGGTLSPGNSAGTLTVADLLWTSGALVFDLGPTPAQSDLLDAVQLEGFSTSYAFTFVNRDWRVGTTYDLIKFDASTIPIDAFTYTNGNGFDGVFSYNDNVLQFTINVAAIPEPGTLVLLMLAGVPAAMHRARSRWAYRQSY
ncbi:MAG: autotransporter-associated beta strand repeat-containing protein [Planctomycetaceae bacterium]|nr:autotransporter-associated beta strand repeat-containing protein [Planctomycetaceae bacterium]